MIYCICSSQVSNFFLSAETVILGCSWVAFKPVMACKMMHQIAYGFYLSIKKCSKLGQKSFWLCLPTPYDKPQDFAKWKTLLRYNISVLSFIIIVFVVVILKIFGLVQHPWNGPFLGFFCTLLSQILFNLADILTRGSLQ